LTRGRTGAILIMALRYSALGPALPSSYPLRDAELLHLADGLIGDNPA
jgi:hypothetical protein